MPNENIGHDRAKRAARSHYVQRACRAVGRSASVCRCVRRWCARNLHWITRHDKKWKEAEERERRERGRSTRCMFDSVFSRNQLKRTFPLITELMKLSFGYSLAIDSPELIADTLMNGARNELIPESK